MGGELGAKKWLNWVAHCRTVLPPFSVLKMLEYWFLSEGSSFSMVKTIWCSYRGVTDLYNWQSVNLQPHKNLGVEWYKRPRNLNCLSSYVTLAYSFNRRWQIPLPQWTNDISIPSQDCYTTHGPRFTDGSISLEPSGVYLYGLSYNDGKMCQRF